MIILRQRMYSFDKYIDELRREASGKQKLYSSQPTPDHFKTIQKELDNLYPKWLPGDSFLGLYADKSGLTLGDQGEYRWDWDGKEWTDHFTKKKVDIKKEVSSAASHWMNIYSSLPEFNKKEKSEINNYLTRLKKL